jgi:radical SAM protein with 4Fe4S-binding SPASM domain
MAALQPAQVDISLLGASDATFDAVARSKQTLSRVLRGVRLLQERGVRVKLNTLLLDLNVAERGQMVELAQQLGVLYEQVFKVSAADDGSDRAGQHQLGRQQITALFQADQTPFQPARRSAESRTCQVGLAACLISPYGEVYPCNELRISAGRLTGPRRQPFAEIWANGPIFQRLRAQHTLANLPECRVCPINAYCEGRCSGLAWKEHGDLYGGQSLACQQAQARFEQQTPRPDRAADPLAGAPAADRQPAAGARQRPSSAGHSPAGRVNAGRPAHQTRLLLESLNRPRGEHSCPTSNSARVHGSPGVSGQGPVGRSRHHPGAQLALCRLRGAHRRAVPSEGGPNFGFVGPLSGSSPQMAAAYVIVPLSEWSMITRLL